MKEYADREVNAEASTATVSLHGTLNDIIEQIG